MYEPERFRSAEYLAVLADSASPLPCTFSEAAMATMKEAAERVYPFEVCGLLIGRFNDNGWTIEEARQIENLNRERAADRFQLDPLGYQAVDRELRGSGREIIGVFHSHPDCPAKPSPTDLESAWEGFLYPIVSVCEAKTAQILTWTLDSSTSQFQRVNTTSDA